jgi:hypothetical protein
MFMLFAGLFGALFAGSLAMTDSDLPEDDPQADPVPEPAAGPAEEAPEMARLAAPPPVAGSLNALASALAETPPVAAADTAAFDNLPGDLPQQDAADQGADGPVLMADMTDPTPENTASPDDPVTQADTGDMDWADLTDGSETVLMPDLPDADLPPAPAPEPPGDGEPLSDAALRDLILALGEEDTGLPDGGPGDDSVTGGTGDDDIAGGAGHDTLAGGPGHDRLVGGAGDDSLIGGQGDDTIRAGTGDDRVIGGWGDDLIAGGAGSDVLMGGDGDDTVHGGADTARDHLNGGDGNDLVLIGGNDVASGGDGADTFVLGPLETAVAALITDFDPAMDRLVIAWPAGQPFPDIGVTADPTDPTAGVVTLDGVQAAVVVGGATLTPADIRTIAA